MKGSCPNVLHFHNSAPKSILCVIIQVSFARAKESTFIDLAINFDIDVSFGLPQLHYGR